MRKIARKIVACMMSLVMILGVVPVTGMETYVKATEASEFVKNGGFEDVSWYQMPTGWDTNLGYVYDNFDGDSHYSTQTCANNVTPATYIQDGVGVNGTKGAYLKSSDASGNYSFTYKDTRTYDAITSADVKYDYLMGCDYHTPTGVSSSSIGVYFRAFLYHGTANVPMNAATSGAFDATAGYTSLKKSTQRNNANKGAALVYEFGLRNAVVGNELYYDNAYCVPNALKASDASANALEVMANAEWYQEIPVSASTREYFFNARMAGPDAVIELRQYSDTEEVGTALTVPSTSMASDTFAAIEQQTITLEDDTTSVKIILKNVADSTALSLFDDISLMAECDDQLDITPVALRNFFSENMVLQRGKPHNIWGTGEPGENYNVSLSDGGENSSTTMFTIGADGTWNASLDPLPASTEPYTLTISHETKPDIKVINNVFVGDVFLLAGQSNMYYNYNYNGSSLGVLTNPNVKYLIVENVASSSPVTEPTLDSEFSTWAELSGDTEGKKSYVSTIGMYFSQYLSETQPDVPIGLLNVPWGGTEIIRWNQDGNIYNNHVAPFANYNLAGILWYQGCQDANTNLRTYLYTTRFANMIDQYRELFGDANLPFLYVQLARNNNTNNFGEIRSIQKDVLDLVKNPTNVGMITSLDTDKGTGPGDIHPLGKEILAKRFADYFKNMRNDADAPEVVVGPTAEKATLDKEDATKVVLSFKEGTSEGLQVKNPDYSEAQDGSGCSSATELQEFEIAGVDKNFVDATATIVDNTVVLYAESIKKPAYVRYAYDNVPENPNLANGAGLPAPAFTMAVSDADTSPKGTGNQHSDATPDGLVFDEVDNGDGTFTVALKPKAWTDGSTTNYAEVFFNESDTNSHYDETALIVGRGRAMLQNYALSDFFKDKEVSKVTLTLKKYNGHTDGNRPVYIRKLYDNSWAASLDSVKAITSKNMPFDRHLDYDVFKDEMALNGSADKVFDLTELLKDNMSDMNEISFQIGAKEIYGDKNSEKGSNIAKGASLLTITYTKEPVEDEVDLTNGIAFQGAQIRTAADNQGLRFVSLIKRTLKDKTEVPEGVAGIEYGNLLIPEVAFNTSEEKVLDMKTVTEGVICEVNGKRVNVKAAKVQSTVDYENNASMNYVKFASLLRIGSQTTIYKQNFVVRPYLIYLDAAGNQVGEVVYVDQESRNMHEIAKVVLQGDVSQYSADELEYLNSVAAE
ncbi:MAG: sialate O-acetylesterase [Lachnospiraceae bacterium]